MISKRYNDVRRSNPPDFVVLGQNADLRISKPALVLRPLILSFAFSLFVGCNNQEPADSGATNPAVTDSIARDRQDSINRTLPGYVVDSILPVEEELRRFRMRIGGETISSLKGGASSRDSLVRNFLSSLQASDSAALKAMVLNAGEFAWLVYPESPYTRPPYTQAPALVWNQIENPSASGFTRLVRRLAGEKLAYAGYTCSKQSDRQGRNMIWTNCTVKVGEPGEKVRARRLFGSIIERDGQFKLVSFANEF
ncbi:MAG: hypothetical protein ABJC63_01540 [Gemmatimonadales bacterium]